MGELEMSDMIGGACVGLALGLGVISSRPERLEDDGMMMAIDEEELPFCWTV